MTEGQDVGDAGEGEPGADGRQRTIIMLCPHFRPDTAPTGDVMSRLVEELARRGHRLHVVTALPWYRAHAIEKEWAGRLVRRQRTPWGSITRIYPFPGSDRRSLLRRAAGFCAFSAFAGVVGVRAGGWFHRVDAVIAMSPPLTMGLTGRVVAWSHRSPQIFNIQDVFPDAAVETGAVANRRVIRLAHWLEAFSYRRADAVTVLSRDLADNVVKKVDGAHRAKVRTIPNFVDTDVIRPLDRHTALREELGIGDEPVVLYAGNIGFSQSLALLLGAAGSHPDVTFLINGEGSGRTDIEHMAADLDNVRFGSYVPVERLSELLATGDIHVVPLRAGLARVSVPSKTYSILAAARPVLASIDAGTEIPKVLAESGAGVAVAPDDQQAFDEALDAMLADPEGARAMGRAGRRWVEQAASPTAIAAAYDRLVVELGRPRDIPARR